LGLGAGATGAILASRWTKKQAKRVAPQTLAREAKGGILDLSKLVAESIDEGKRAMAEREAELRDDNDLSA
jgi:ERCC4-related helicase